MPDIWNRREVYRGLGNKRAFKNPVVLGRGVNFFFFGRHRLLLLHCGQKEGQATFWAKKGKRLAGKRWRNCKRTRDVVRRKRASIYQPALQRAACEASFKPGSPGSWDEISTGRHLLGWGARQKFQQAWEFAANRQ